MRIEKNVRSRPIESYFGPAVIVGQVTGVQNSVRVPYKRFT